MATLSANSRRNSSTSSNLNSPRPSISGCLITNLTTKMTSLNEEDDVVDIFPVNSKINSVKFKNKICSERSDSGFSECSNGSAQSIVCGCAGSLNSDDTSIIISHDILKTKLEQIAENQTKDTILESSNCFDLNTITEKQLPVAKDISYQHTTQAGMSSIEQRKKSLEHNFTKEPIIKTNTDKKMSEKYGKVSMLKEKFSEIGVEPAQPKLRTTKTTPSCIQGKLHTQSITKNSSYVVKPFKIGQTTKLDDSKLILTPCEPKLLTVTKNPKTKIKLENPHTPSPSQLPAVNTNKINLKICTANNIVNSTVHPPMRLSVRVREVTERLSSPKIQSPTRIKTLVTKPKLLSSKEVKPTRNSNSSISTIKSSIKKEKFKEIAAFWEK